MSGCAWPLGLVSNCWKVQLDSGVTLDSLIAEAARRGLTVIELRQGSLGDYEAGPMAVPQADRLAELARNFPGVSFNLALSLPCLSGDLRRDDSLFLAGRAAAMALSQSQPHLRLVDLQTRPESCSESLIESAARGLVPLTEAMIEVGGMLSIEHARQPWRWFDSAMTAARRRLGERGSRLRLCFDPCNLLLTESVADITGIVESVRPEDVSMIHVKQRRDGQVQPDLADGDLDWPELYRVLLQGCHRVPVLLELAPHADVWRHLELALENVAASGQLAAEPPQAGCL